MLAFFSNIFGYLLNFLYELLNNFGYAIILFSILLRIILLPITIKQQKSVEKTQKLQGQLKALQLKYKNNPEMLNKETMELYKREKISPTSGCLSGIIQIIIILSVFFLVSQPLTYMKKANDTNPELKTVVENYKTQIKEENNSKTRYIEIEAVARIRDDYEGIKEKLNQEIIEGEQSREELETKKNQLEKLNINMDFLSLDLSMVPSEHKNNIKVYIIPALYVISSFLSITLTNKMQNKSKKKDKENGENEIDNMAQMSKSMSYMMIFTTLFVAFIAPLGLALYWFVSNLLMIIERLVITKIVEKKEADGNE